MKPYCVVCGDISKSDLRFHQVVKLVVDAIPNDFKLPSGDLLSCHLVSAVLARLIPRLKAETGHFLIAFRHSWLITPNGNLIDPYPVAAVGGPLLLVRKEIMSPWARSTLYEAGRPLQRGEKWKAGDYRYLFCEMRRSIKKFIDQGQIKAIEVRL